jgi:hypothetical protein
MILGDRELWLASQAVTVRTEQGGSQQRAHIEEDAVDSFNNALLVGATEDEMHWGTPELVVWPILPTAASFVSPLESEVFFVELSAVVIHCLLHSLKHILGLVRILRLTIVASIKLLQHFLTKAISRSALDNNHCPGLCVGRTRKTA